MELIQKNDLIRTILSMPPLERIDLVDRVLQSFNSKEETDYEQNWAEESELRVEGFLNGSIKSIPAPEIFRKINEIEWN